MISHPMGELVLCCFSPSLLLAKTRFVLSDLAGRLSSCQVVGHCISWSRGIENTVNIPSLQMPGCSFWVSEAIGDGRARGKVCGGGGRGDLWPPGGCKELLTASRASKRAACRWML